MKCKSCGADIQSGVKFCNYCGAAVSTRSAQQPTNSSATSQSTDQESRNKALMIWIGTIFLGFIPGLIMYMIEKNDAFVIEQSKEALNWSITAIIGYFISIMLALLLVGFVTATAVGICHIIFCIMGAVQTSNGENFKVPFAIRLVK